MADMGSKRGEIRVVENEEIKDELNREEMQKREEEKLLK
jgi:hypothetical protein